MLGYTNVAFLITSNANNIDAPNSIDDSINDSIDNQNINESNTNSFDVFANVNALLNQF